MSDFPYSNLREFVKKSICPRENGEINNDLRVDVFGNFKVVFKKISDTSFATPPKYGKFELLDDENIYQYIRSINDFELNASASKLDLPGMSYALHRLMPMNSQNTIQMNWLNTKTPYIETFFVPWMQDNTINGAFPLVKCNLIITFPKLKESNSQEIQYIYYGIRPIEIGMHKMTNEPLQDFYRKVVFDFDYFYCLPQANTNIKIII